jgi:hypothetical protein
MDIHQARYSFLKGDGIDGMLLYLFARAGFANRVSVDIGSGDCVNGNTANLVLFHGFKGYMIDFSAAELATGKRVFESISGLQPPAFIAAMVTGGAINAILREHAVPERIDLLSIDIDSVDLYIVQQVSIQARVIVVEFNNLWGPDECYSVPNRDGFQREFKEFLYGGASLAAFQKVLRPKGYKLVGIAESGFDAFFVLDDADFREIPESSIHSLYDRSPIWRQRHRSSLGDAIRNKEWVQI